MTSTTPTKSDTRAVIPITTPSSFTQHIIGSVTSIFSPRSDCYIAAIDPDHFQSAPTALNAEIFPGFWCIPPNYFQSSSTVPWSSQCWPTQAESDDDTFRHFVGPYSPGLHCMEGWTTAMKMEPAISGGHAYVVSDRTLTPESYFSFYYPSSTLLSDESGAICCPSYVLPRGLVYFL
jgi:hypothetical protein